MSDFEYYISDIFASCSDLRIFICPGTLLCIKGVQEGRKGVALPYKAPSHIHLSCHIGIWGIMFSMKVATVAF